MSLRKAVKQAGSRERGAGSKSGRLGESREKSRVAHILHQENLMEFSHSVLKPQPLVWLKRAIKIMYIYLASMGLPKQNGFR